MAGVAVQEAFLGVQETLGVSKETGNSGALKDSSAIKTFIPNNSV